MTEPHAIAPPNAPRPFADTACDALVLVFAFALPLSIAVTEIALVLALVSWAATRPWRRPWPRGLVALAWTSAALLATWLVASATSAQPIASFVAVRKLYAVAALFLIADRARDQTRARRIAAVALTGGALSAVFGLVGYAVARYAQSIPYYRLEGAFSTAMTSGNVFATLAVAGLGVVFLGGVRRAARWGTAVAAGACAIALVGTLTRSSWLAFLAGIATLLGLRRARYLAMLGLGLAIALAVAPPELRARAVSILDPNSVLNVPRISMWKSGWHAIQDRPLTGYGLQDMLDLIARYRRPEQTFTAGHFHNNWVQVTVATGVVGLAAFATWMGLAALLLVRRLGTGERAWAALGLAVWAVFQVHGLFDWSFGDVEVVDQLYLWLGLALGAGGLGRQALVRSGRKVVPFIGRDEAETPGAELISQRARMPPGIPHIPESPSTRRSRPKAWVLTGS